MKSRIRYFVGLIIVWMIVWRNTILCPSYDVTSYYAKLWQCPDGVHQFNLDNDDDDEDEDEDERKNDIFASRVSKHILEYVEICMKFMNKS